LLRLLDHEQVMLSLYFDKGNEIQQVFLSACVRYHAGVQQKNCLERSKTTDAAGENTDGKSILLRN